MNRNKRNRVVEPTGAVEIQCSAVDYIKCPFGVTVVNSSGEEVFRGSTDINGNIVLTLKKCDTYRFSIFSYGCLTPDIAYRWLMIDPCLNYSFQFFFRTSDFDEF